MCTKDEEYGRAVHCKAPDSGPMQGNIAYYGDVGREKVVGEGGTGPGGSVGTDRGKIRGGGGGR